MPAPMAVPFFEPLVLTLMPATYGRSAGGFAALTAISAGTARVSQAVSACSAAGQYAVRMRYPSRSIRCPIFPVLTQAQRFLLWPNRQCLHRQSRRCCHCHRTLHFNSDADAIAILVHQWSFQPL